MIKILYRKRNSNALSIGRSSERSQDKTSIIHQILINTGYNIYSVNIFYLINSVGLDNLYEWSSYINFYNYIGEYTYLTQWSRKQIEGGGGLD